MIGPSFADAVVPAPSDFLDQQVLLSNHTSAGRHRTSAALLLASASNNLSSQHLVTVSTFCPRSLQFCTLTESVASALEISPPIVADLSKRFDNDANFLFLILERTNAQDLILRLDFNGYFTSRA